MEEVDKTSSPSSTYVVDGVPVAAAMRGPSDRPSSTLVSALMFISAVNRLDP